MNEESYIFKNVLGMKDAIGNRVVIKTVDNKSHAGFIYVIDPTSRTVVLVNETGSTLDIILYNAISSIDIVEGIKKIFRHVPKCEDSTESVEEKK